MNTFFYDFVKITALPYYMILRPKYFYENENARKKIRGGVLIISNHSGFQDPIYLLTAIYWRRLRFVCTKEILGNRLNRWLFTHFLCIPIDRENFSYNSFREIVKGLKDGNACVIFPQGKIIKNDKKLLAKAENLDDNLSGGLKEGMLLMSMSSGAPVMPVLTNKERGFFKRLRVCVGEPINVKELLGNNPTKQKIDETAAVIEKKFKLLNDIIN